MKKYQYVIILLFIISLAVVLNDKPIQAQIATGITSITIKTNNGTIQSGGNLNFYGANGMKVTNNATGLIFSPNIIAGTGLKLTPITNSSGLTITANRIVTTGSLQQISWNPQVQNNYLSVQMELNSQYPLLVQNTQAFQGQVTNVAITPLVNTMSSPMTLTLFDNGISTGKSIVIRQGLTSGFVTTINQPFNQGDSLTWVISSKAKDANSLMFNAQVMISYIG